MVAALSFSLPTVPSRLVARLPNALQGLKCRVAGLSRDYSFVWLFDSVFGFDLVFLHVNLQHIGVLVCLQGQRLPEGLCGDRLGGASMLAAPAPVSYREPSPWSSETERGSEAEAR